MLVVASLLAAPVLLTAQNPAPRTGTGTGTGTRVIVDPATLTKPLADEWPTFAGDYTSRRYSTLKQINTTNVKNLTLAWMTTVLTGPRGGVPPTIIGGVGTREFTGGTIKGAVLQVGGILYVTAPDNVWALDALDGREIWHYFWKTRGATHIGNRGAAIWYNSLFFETPDNYLVSLDAKTGKENWYVEIADFDEQYFSTPAPIIVDNHVIVGTGNDLDGPGFLQSFDPETGKLQWKFYTVPMKAGDPGLETWPSLEAAKYGGGHTWMPGSYDPETRLYIFGTGNPTPAYTGVGRPGDNLYTCALVALNVDTGKMAWYYQMSPHDTHDWDTVQNPMLIDATHQRQAAQARVGRRAQRILLHRRSRHGRAHRDDEIRHAHELGGRAQQHEGARGRRPRRKRSSRALSCLPSREGRRTGSRPPIRPIPAWSTRRKPIRSTCCISPIPIRADRWGSAESCVSRSGRRGSS